MVTLIIILLVYAAGQLLSYSMLRVEQAASKEPFTKGARALIGALSLLSWVMVIITLVNTWVDTIRETGYWSEEVKAKEIPTEVKIVK